MVNLENLKYSMNKSQGPGSGVTGNRPEKASL